LKKKKIDAIISTIVFMEVLVGFFQNDEQNKANKFASSTMLNFDLIPVDYELARKGAKIRAQYNIKLPDAIIPATTLLYECDYFISNNKKLLKKLKIQRISPEVFVKNYLD
jgi:predicted nucleic acid-binding protein